MKGVEMDEKDNITQEENLLLCAYLELFVGCFMLFLFVLDRSVSYKLQLFTEYSDFHIC